MLHPGHIGASVYQGLAGTAQAEERDVPRPARQEAIRDMHERCQFADSTGEVGGCCVDTRQAVDPN